MKYVVIYYRDDSLGQLCNAGPQASAAATSSKL